LPDNRASADDANDFSQAGFRVPTVLASPRARRNFVDSTQYDHTSVMRFLEWRFLGAPARGPGKDNDTWFLTKRDQRDNLGETLRLNDRRRLRCRHQGACTSAQKDEGRVRTRTDTVRTVAAGYYSAPVWVLSVARIVLVHGALNELGSPRTAWWMPARDGPGITGSQSTTTTSCASTAICSRAPGTEWDDKSSIASWDAAPSDLAGADTISAGQAASDAFERCRHGDDHGDKTRPAFPNARPPSHVDETLA
jgi:hypothetical protein